MIPEALQEMKEVEVSFSLSSYWVWLNTYLEQELEITLHGDRSVNIAKTYKVIGTLYMIDNPPKPQEAKEYLLRAQSIFEQRGLPKMLKEVKEKIKLINRQVKSGVPMMGHGAATAEAADIIEESAYDSNGEGGSGMHP